MSREPDGGNFATTDNEDFDPRDAAAILTKSTRKARRQFNANPPLIGLIRAALVLLAYGTIWLNVRGQHPYVGPKSWTIVMLISVTGIIIRMSRLVFQLATEGVSGRPVARSWWAEICAVVLVLAGVFALMGALVQAGAAFAGPAGAWGVAGLGLCAALLGHTAAIVWRRRSKAVR